MTTPLEDRLASALRRANNWFSASMSRASVGLLPSDEQMYLETLGTLSEYNRPKEDANRECAMQELADQAQELNMGYGSTKAIVDDDEHMTPDRAWNHLCAMDDRNSPADCPDHCLITKGELARYMRAAVPTAKATEPSDLVTELRDIAAGCDPTEAYPFKSETLKRTGRALRSAADRIKALEAENTRILEVFKKDAYSCRMALNRVEDRERALKRRIEALESELRERP